VDGNSVCLSEPIDFVSADGQPCCFLILHGEMFLRIDRGDFEEVVDLGWCTGPSPPGALKLKKGGIVAVNDVVAITDISRLVTRPEVVSRLRVAGKTAVRDADAVTPVQTVTSTRSESFVVQNSGTASGIVEAMSGGMFKTLSSGFQSTEWSWEALPQVSVHPPAGNRKIGWQEGGCDYPPRVPGLPRRLGSEDLVVSDAHDDGLNVGHLMSVQSIIEADARAAAVQSLQSRMAYMEGSWTRVAGVVKMIVRHTQGGKATQTGDVVSGRKTRQDGWRFLLTEESGSSRN